MANIRISTDGNLVILYQTLSSIVVIDAEQIDEVIRKLEAARDEIRMQVSVDKSEVKE